MTGAFLCLATALFFEARSEGPDAMSAVADVIQQRVEDKRYPNDVCSVVKEPSAFSFYNDGLHDDPSRHTGYQDKIAWDVAKETATASMNGDGFGLTATHYHTQSISPMWKSHYVLVGKIGSHLFYNNETPYK